MNQSELTLPEGRSKGYQVLFVIAVLLVAINLRPAITSVGPLIGIIRDDVGFSNWNIAFLTSLPLIAFMLVSPIAPKLAKRFTAERTLAIALFILVVGIGLRSVPFMFYLFFGTILIGSGIALCNVLLPSVIQDKFTYKIGIMTSLYTAFMNLSATIASGISVPLAQTAGLGWNRSLLLWAIPAAIGLIIWLIIAKINTKPSPIKVKETAKGEVKKSIWKEPLAWMITLFMGFQSLTFYTMLSWLPEILSSSGMDISTAGIMLSYLQLLGIPFSFIMPMVAVRIGDQRLIVIVVNTLFVVGLIFLLLSHSFIGMFIAITLTGMAVGSNFSLALTFLSIRAQGAQNVAELSGMAQSIGYCIAALGPVLLGLLFDITQEWKYPIMVLIAVVVTLTFFGYQAGKKRLVFAN